MKLPIEATVKDGYRFLFTNIVSVIGTIWLPYLLLAALLVGAGYVVLPHDLSWHNISGIADALASPKANAARGLFGIVSLIVSSMVLVNLMRHSLGLNEKTTWIYFSLGAPVWRMAGAILLAGIILFLVVILLVVIGVCGGYAAFQRLDAMAASAVTAAIVVVGLFLFAYLGVRLFFFLPAVVVAENRLGIGRAFALAKGNFWRIFVVWAAIVLPVWFVTGIILQASVLPIILSAASQLPRHPTLDDIEPLIRSFLNVLPVVLPVALVAGIAIRAYLVGVIGSAYKSAASK